MRALRLVHNFCLLGCVAGVVPVFVVLTILERHAARCTLAMLDDAMSLGAERRSNLRSKAKFSTSAHVPKSDSALPMCLQLPLIHTAAMANPSTSRA
jgi:hypothetical protein